MVPMFLLLQIGSLTPVVPADVCARFNAFDQNGDGQVEITSLAPIALPGGNAKPRAGDNEGHGRVLMLVEGRILQPLKGSVDLLPQLELLHDDLIDEGYDPCAVAVELAPSESHQDGRYILALRDVLRAFNGDERLAGVLLVGHFPDAYLARTCNWRRKGDIQLRGEGAKVRSHKDVHYVRRVPEHVSQRADIVLADLDGPWEDLYIQPETKLRRTIAVFDSPAPRAGGSCVDLEVGYEVFEDCFHISDGKFEVQPLVGESDASPARFRVFLDDRSADHECSSDDHSRPNVIAHPEIYVSRIDAWGTARSPREDVLGERGEGLLDAAGQPQVVTWSEDARVPDWRNGIWRPDALLERQLIGEFLTRNHAFRTGTIETAWRPSSIAVGLESGYRSIAKAATNWEPDDSGLQDTEGKPTLERFVEWMQHPAVLRTIRAHSNPLLSAFGAGDIQELEAVAGGSAWSWSPRGQQLVPSLEAPCKNGHLDWFLMRTLWKNGSVAVEPSIYLHTGCEAVSPPNSRRRPFSAPSYGAMQGAEALLFMGNGLALVGRAKVFYDEPKGFAETLRAGGTVGAAWAEYYEVESNAATWDQAGGDIGRKRSYFWSVLGDWTLRLSMAEPPQPGAAPERGLDAQAIELQDSQLFVPSDLDLTANAPVPLYIHFQGGVTAARNNFESMERPGVLLASTLSGFSGAFTRPFQDPKLFQSLLDSVEAALSERAGRPVTCGPIVITFFSAGYGAVREILKHPNYFDRVTGLVAADSIYASVVGETARAPEAEQMVDFLRFAQAAARGEKTFVLVHGMYPTEYASTSECANLILASVGAERVPHERVNERGLSTSSEAHVGDFHLYTFDSAEPEIHGECFQMLPELVRRHL